MILKNKIIDVGERERASTNTYRDFELVEDELDYHVVFDAQQLGDALADPWLDHLQVHLRHVHLWKELCCSCR